MTETETPEAQPGEVAFVLSWHLESGYLTGQLEARNVSDHRIRLAGKPGLKPLGLDGEPLSTDTIVSAELKLPGYVELAPGERARSQVGWGGWDRPAASGRVLVRWHGGQVEVTADGPAQPEAEGPPTNLWSSWFVRVD